MFPSSKYSNVEQWQIWWFKKLKAPNHKLSSGLALYTSDFAFYLMFLSYSFFKRGQKILKAVATLLWETAIRSIHSFPITPGKCVAGRPGPRTHLLLLAHSGTERRMALLVIHAIESITGFSLARNIHKCELLEMQGLQHTWPSSKAPIRTKGKCFLNWH